MDLPNNSKEFCEFLAHVAEFHSDCLDPDITWGQVEEKFYHLKTSLDTITNNLIPRYELTSSVTSFNNKSSYILLSNYNNYLLSGQLPLVYIIKSVYDRIIDAEFLNKNF